MASVKFYTTSCQNFDGREFDLKIPEGVSHNPITIFCMDYFFKGENLEAEKFHLIVNKDHYFIRKRGQTYIVLNYAAAVKFLPNAAKTEETFLRFLQQFPLIVAPPEIPKETEIPKESSFKGILFICSDELMSRSEGKQEEGQSLNDHVIAPEIFFAVRKNTARYIHRRFKDLSFERKALDRFFYVDGKILGVFGWIERRMGRPKSYSITTMFYASTISVRNRFKLDSQTKYDKWLENLPKISTQKAAAT